MLALHLMTDHQKLSFKAFKLKNFALDLIGQRMTTAKEAMQQAQESANSEEKSSAGDKYETGRAMGHLQRICMPVSSQRLPGSSPPSMP